MIKLFLLLLLGSLSPVCLFADASPSLMANPFKQLENVYMHKSGNWGVGVNSKEGFFMILERIRPDRKYVPVKGGFGLSAGYALPTPGKRISFKVIKLSQDDDHIFLEVMSLNKGSEDVFEVNAHYDNDGNGSLDFKPMSPEKASRN